MAADRLSPQLAYLTDPWQPAVLRLIQHTCVVGSDNNVPGADLEGVHGAGEFVGFYDGNPRPRRLPLQRRDPSRG